MVAKTVPPTLPVGVEPPKPARSFYPGIQARITAPFLLVVVLVAAIGVFMTTRLVSGSIQERFNNQLVDSATAASNAVVDIERQQLATLRLMVFTEGIPAAINANDTTNLELWLRPVAANADVDNIIVYDVKGRGLLELKRAVADNGVEYHTAAPPANLSQWIGVQRVLNGNADILGDKYVDVIGTAPNVLFYISAPVRTADNTIVGGITLGLSAQRFSQRIGLQSLSSLVLFSDKGTVLGGTYRNTPLNELNLTATHASELLTEVQQTSPIEEITIENTRYQILFAQFLMRSQSIGLMGVALPSNFIVERSGTSRDLVGLLFSGLFVVVGLLGVFSARSITRPVKRLVETTRLIRSGNLSQRTQITVPDEIGELAVSFDHMTDALVQRNVEIQSLYDQQIEETVKREAVLTSISDAVMVRDVRGKIIMRNRTAEELIYTLARKPEAARLMGNLFLNPGDLAEPQTLRFGERYFSVLATPVCMPSGEMLGHVFVFRDITAIIEAELLKDEMILQMSHELRTPLSATRGYVELVKMVDGAKLSEQSHKFIGQATDGLTTLERMVNQVVDVSAILSNRFTLDLETFDLAELLEERVSVWQPLVQQREHTLTLIPPEEEWQVQGDFQRLSEVLDHLLRNSSNYTLPGGGLEIHADVRLGYLTISVVDNGVGIGCDEIEKVFERGYRGRSADAGPTDARGLGLGLYIAKEIVEAHHGQIEIQSEKNVGTLVTITLPLRQQPGNN